MPQLICGFPGVGKSHFHRAAPPFTVRDSDSSAFGWGAGPTPNPTRDPNWVVDYIAHIKACLMTPEVTHVLVSSHQEVRAALVAEGMPFILVYPGPSLKEEYIQRYIARGNNPAFVTKLVSFYEVFIEGLMSQKGCEHLILKSGQYLSDVAYPGPQRPLVEPILVGYWPEIPGPPPSAQERRLMPEKAAQMDKDINDAWAARQSALVTARNRAWPGSGEEYETVMGYLSTPDRQLQVRSHELCSICQERISVDECYKGPFKYPWGYLHYVTEHHIQPPPSVFTEARKAREKALYTLRRAVNTVFDQWEAQGSPESQKDRLVGQVIALLKGHPC